MSKWEWKKLGEVCEIICGQDYKDVECESGAYPVYGSGGVIGYAREFRCPANCTIVGRKGSINNPMYVEEPFWNIDTAFGLSAKECMESKYLFYFCKCFDFTTLDKSSGRPSLARKDLLEIQIPIPLLSEQKRIVKFLDEEFSKIDTLKTNAETNLKNAKELFETTLEKELNPLSRHSERSEESSAELPSGWEWVALNNVCKKIFAGGDKPQNCSKKSNEILSVPVYANAIENEGLYGYTDKAVVKEPCLTISARGTIGFTVKRTEPFVPIIRLIVLIPKMDVIDLDYFFFSVKHLKIVGNGTSIPQLTVPLVKQYTIPLPPLSVQKEIVARIDKLSENVKRLEANYKQIIADCDELKKSILKKTFEGDSRSNRE